MAAQVQRNHADALFSLFVAPFFMQYMKRQLKVFWLKYFIIPFRLYFQFPLKVQIYNLRSRQMLLLDRMQNLLYVQCLVLLQFICILFLHFISNVHLDFKYLTDQPLSYCPAGEIMRLISNSFETLLVERFIFLCETSY